MTTQTDSTEIVVTTEGPQGPPGPAGPGDALTVSYDDTLTQLGATTVQGAIVALFEIVAGGQT